MDSEGTNELLAESRRAFRRLNGLAPAKKRAAHAPDSEQLFRAAHRHRMVGLLHAGGAYTARAWRHAAYGQARHTAELTAEAERLFTALAATLRQVVLIKGPALAHQAWPDPGLRAFDDLDFRCARNDYTALCATLNAAGCQATIADERLRSHYWHFGWGLAFQTAGGFTVEVNHRYFPPHFPAPPTLHAPATDLFASLPLDAHAVLAPTPAFHLLLACMHAFWHGGERLAWVADIAGLLARHPAALAQADADVGRSGFPRRALHTGCFLAERLFGPGLVCRDLPAKAPDAADAFIARLGSNRYPSPAERRHAHQALLDPFERAAYTLRRLSVPGDGDFRRWALPPRRRPLYWILRPLRALLPSPAKGEDTPSQL